MLGAAAEPPRAALAGSTSHANLRLRAAGAARDTMSCDMAKVRLDSSTFRLNASASCNVFIRQFFNEDNATFRAIMLGPCRYVLKHNINISTFVHDPVKISQKSCYCGAWAMGVGDRNSARWGQALCEPSILDTPAGNNKTGNAVRIIHRTTNKPQGTKSSSLKWYCFKRNKPQFTHPLLPLSLCQQAGTSESVPSTL